MRGALAGPGLGEHLSPWCSGNTSQQPQNPTGRGTSRRAAKAPTWATVPRTHVPPLGPPVASTHLRRRWPGAKQTGLQGPASAPRTPGTAPALPRWGSAVPEGPCLLPVSRGLLHVPSAHGQSGSSAAPLCGPHRQVLVTQACAECHSTGPDGKPAGGHRRTWPRRLGRKASGGRFSGQGGSAGAGASRGFGSSACALQGQRTPDAPSLHVPLAAPGDPPSLTRRPLSSVEAVALPAGVPTGPSSTPPRFPGRLRIPSRTAAPACRHGCWFLLGTEPSCWLSPCLVARTWCSCG